MPSEQPVIARACARRFASSVDIPTRDPVVVAVVLACGEELLERAACDVDVEDSVTVGSAAYRSLRGVLASTAPVSQCIELWTAKGISRGFSIGRAGKRDDRRAVAVIDPQRADAPAGQ